MSRLTIHTFAFLTLVAVLGCGGGGGSTPPTPVPPPAPTLSGITPAHGAPGSSVALTGTNLTGATSVYFNGHVAFSFSVASATVINAVVPGNATTGTLQITTPNGSATSPSFTVDPAQTPTLSSFAPTTLTSGTVVTLTGTHFVGASQVLFNGVGATTFSIVSDTQIQATAPSGLTLGTIAVTTPGGTATSSTSYSVGSAIQVLMNTGFEQTTPVIWQGETGVIQSTATANSPGVVPHGGTLFAYLGGYGGTANPPTLSDQISQDLYIPATAASATATFYLKIITAETGSTSKDTVTVTALSSTGTLLSTLLTKSNLDAADYTPYTVDLLPFKGQVVRLSFKSQEDTVNATSFLLDDVVAQIVVPTATDLKPIISTFTPPSGIAGEVTAQITGGNFFGVTGLTIGGVTATYTLTDGTKLSAPVPATVPSGSAAIRITNAQGTSTSVANFTVTYGAPTITGMNPTSGPVGTSVVITGTYLGYPATTLTLSGAPITPTTQTASQITFTVPVGATTGNLVITTSGGTATKPFTVNTASTTLDLHIEKVQLTQSSQTLDNSVPIVAGRAGLIRAFVLANQTNTATPSVRFTLTNNGAVVPGYPKTVTATGTSVPTVLDESLLTKSWNLIVPGTELTTPLGSGYSVMAEVDPTSAIAEADKTNNTFTTSTLVGTTVPTFKTTIFPVALATGTGNISEANKAQWVARLAKMYPVASVDVLVGATFTSSVTLSADGTGWKTLLNDLAAKHQADGASDRYYYGALNVSYGSGVAGLGYVPGSSSDSFQYRTAIGWDKATGGYQDGGFFPEVFAHETGHNMGRWHSPCATGSNVPANPDLAYPYAGGTIGVWGYDSVLNVLHSPLVDKDIMGYCTPNWVSDWVYKGILNFRNGTGGFLKVGAEDAPLPKAQATARECLLVRGIVQADGQVELLPAFRTQALPSAPISAGDYTLACLDAMGQPLFTTALELLEVGCSPQGQERHFVMALPLDAAVLDALAGLNVIKGGKVLSSVRSVAATALMVAAAPDLQRLTGDQVQLTWDATLHPSVMVRDADTGEVLAILSGGRQPFATKAQRFDLVLSDGVTSRTHRVATPD